MSNIYPPYIKHSAEYNSGLPYSFEKARYYNFLLKGTESKIQQLCDTFINHPSGFAVTTKPLVPFVIVTFADYPKAYSSALPPEKYGFMQYQEAVFTVVLRTTEGICRQGGETVSFIPFLFLDNPRAIAAGREVFALPKVHGTVKIPKENESGQNAQFSCELVTLPSFGAGVQARNCRILEVNAPSGFVCQGPIGSPKASWDEIDSHVQNGFSEEGVGREDAKALTRSMQLPFINLRQFRGFPNTVHAAYQSVFSYQAKNARFSAGGSLIGDFQMYFPEESPLFPIVSTLGLLPRIYSAFWYEWTFQFYLGPDLWNSQSGRVSRR